MQIPSLYHRPWDRIFPDKWVPGIVLVLSSYKSGSILGAILAHAGFNFGLGFIIFYAL